MFQQNFVSEEGGDKKKVFLAGGQFRAIRKIANGDTSELYLGLNMANGREVAIKYGKTGDNQLLQEQNVYLNLPHGIGIPRILWFEVGEGFCALVMELLGPTLKELFFLCGRKFSLKTVLMLGDNILNVLRLIHEEGFIHRDIKPENILLGVRENSNWIYMIDFGLADGYQNVVGGLLPNSGENKFVTGKGLFASINAHLGMAQSRRDDMEALGYVLLYFLNGTLPWKGIQAVTQKQLQEKIGEKKMSTSVDELTKGLPVELRTFIKHCRDLKFHEEPNYVHLRDLIWLLFGKNNYVWDFAYDWNLPK